MVPLFEDEQVEMVAPDWLKMPLAKKVALTEQ